MAVWILFGVNVFVFQIVLAYVGFALWLSTYFQLMWFTDLGLEEGQKELGIADKILYQECKAARMASRISAVKQIGVGFIIAAAMCGLAYSILEMGFETPQKAYQSILWLIFWGTVPSGMFMIHQARKLLSREIQTFAVSANASQPDYGRDVPKDTTPLAHNEV